MAGLDMASPAKRQQDLESPTLSSDKTPNRDQRAKWFASAMKERLKRSTAPFDSRAARAQFPAIRSDDPMNYPKITLTRMLEQTVERCPDRTALIYFGTRISYGRLLEHVNRCAAGL